jgi:YD repeat-containing protein
VVDAMQNRTTFAYDTGKRLTTVTYPDTTAASFGYDSRGRRTSVTGQNNKTTAYAYDDADRLTSVTEALALHRNFLKRAISVKSRQGTRGILGLC